MMGMRTIIGIATQMANFLASGIRRLRGICHPHEALREAALNRVRSIVMNTLAMILALLPLGAAISGSGDQMLQSLAIVIIAGVTVQLPVVLFALPVVIR
jgi:multidrug efflux pump subunit AcrB